MLAGEPIEVYNHGEMVRDFTYVDDVVEGTGRILTRIPEPSADWDAAHPSPDISSAPFRLYNIGNNRPVRLTEFIAALERELGLEAELRYLPMQPGDVPQTMAEVSDLEAATGFRPATTVEEGIRRFVRWYRDFYRC